MKNINIKGLIKATWREAEFFTKPSEEWDGRYNPSPDFYQALVDAGKHEELPVIELPSTGVHHDLSLPWASEALIHIDGSKVYLVEHYEWDGYTEFEMYHPVESPEAFKNTIIQIIGLIEHGYELGREDGLHAKQREIKKVLGL